MDSIEVMGAVEDQAAKAFGCGDDFGSASLSRNGSVIVEGWGNCGFVDVPAVEV